jgi:hypothetical protein
MHAYLQALKQGKVGEARERLEGIQGNQDVKAARSKKQDESDEARDPYGKKTVAILEKIETASVGMKAALERLPPANAERQVKAPPPPP